MLSITTKPTSVYICHSNVDSTNNTRKIYLTDDVAKAESYEIYHLASLKNLNQWLQVSNDIFTGFLHTTDGIVVYEQDEESDFYGYVKVDHLGHCEKQASSDPGDDADTVEDTEFFDGKEMDDLDDI